MTIEEQIASITRARAACRAAISDLDRNLGIMHALPATIKPAGALDALDAIEARKLGTVNYYDRAEAPAGGQHL